MKVSDLTSEVVVLFCKIDGDATDKALIDKLFLPAAKAHIQKHTGLTSNEMDAYEDLPIAVCALCSHMYDNRSVEVTSEKVNQVVMDIIGKYDKNLIPRGDSA